MDGHEILLPCGAPAGADDIDEWAAGLDDLHERIAVRFYRQRGQAFIDRELYLPKEWAYDAERREESRVPRELEFATKPQLALQMLKRTLEVGVRADWVTGDEVNGGDRGLRMWLE